MKYFYSLLAIFLCLQMNAAMVTFSVDMNEYSGVINTVEINGTFNNFCGTCNPMEETSPGSGVYEVTIDLPAGDIEYKFTVNATTDDEYYETLIEGAPCTVSAFGFTNRFLAIGADDIVLDTACFEACVACDDVLPSYQVVFRVDMSEYTGPSFGSVDVNGSFNGFCGGCAPMTDVGDNVYELAITLEQGTYEYIFTLDGFNTGQESFEDGDPCTSTIDVFVNRTIDVDSDETLAAVCWNSCFECGASSVVEFEKEAFNIFPNPSSGIVQLRSDASSIGDFEIINIYSISGQQVLSERMNADNNYIMDLSSLEKGVYTVELSTENRIAVQSLIIK
ncbi:MAG: T9SS type A sorting domain-containing protein [Flavobacteriales bacterium]|nr:T9SS type A sorting domain-containing protein [Flavobacteriales bacterium]